VRRPLWPIQKTAKRPQTNKGGREEEEKRLGIAAGSRRPERLRSAKRKSATGALAGLLATTPGAPQKFRANADMGFDGLLRAGSRGKNAEFILDGSYCDYTVTI
jgi:hypothetical protein